MRSVFAKYITVFAIIILVSFLMLTSIISVSIDDYATEQKRNDAALLSQITAAFVSGQQWESGTPTLPDFVQSSGGTLNAILESLSPYAKNITIFVTDISGNVLTQSIHTDGADEVAAIPSDLMETVRETPRYTETGRLGDTLKETHLTCTSPVFNAEGTVIGYVFACASSAGEDALIRVLNKSIVLSNLWIMLAVMVAVYFITERLLTPLREMSQAAKDFSRGNFNTRINVIGYDEISEFAVTFNQMAESLAQSENQRSTFLANVAHDLRTPMTTIAGFVDGILDGAIPPEKQNYYLHIVSDEIHRLSRLVSQLLDISRMEAGMRKFNPTDFDICEVARLILISFESKIEQKGLDVQFDTESDRMMVCADRDAIYQIIYNICENAIKFSYDKGVLRISVQPGEKGKYNVCIYNEGPGVPAADLPYIFDRFYKSDKSRGLDKVGVGLGLYITKAILTANGESIRAESEAGKWCSFTFTIRRSEQ